MHSIQPPIRFQPIPRAWFRGHPPTRAAVPELWPGAGPRAPGVAADVHVPHGGALLRPAVRRVCLQEGRGTCTDRLGTV